MSTNCLTEKQLFALADGGVPPNEADALHAHLAGCRMRRDAHAEIASFAADLAVGPDVDRDAHVAAVMSRLDESRPVRPRWRASPRLAASAIALAAAIALLVVRPWRVDESDPAFVARGGGQEATLGRDIGISFFMGTGELVPLRARSRIEAHASLSAAYTNVHPRPAYVLVFAVDAKDTVHWLYPAFLDPQDDPPSPALERAERERHFATSVVLDEPAKGPLRLVTIASERVLHVSDVEHRAPSDRSADALRRALPKASITELVVEIP